MYFVAGIVCVPLFMLYMESQTGRFSDEDRYFIYVSTFLLGAVCGPLFGFLWEHDKRREPRNGKDI